MELKQSMKGAHISWSQPTAIKIYGGRTLKIARGAGGCGTGGI